jgi:DNA-binding NarL/FixJ family response regulator
MAHANVPVSAYDRRTPVSPEQEVALTRHRSASDPSWDHIRLVMVEPRALLGAGIRQVLDRETDIEVVAHVASPSEALPVVDEEAPDVVLVNSPTADQFDADGARRLRRESPDSAFVVVGAEDDDASIVGAVEIGAMAHVPEVAEPAELVATIRRVAHGEDPLKDELDGRPDLVERLLDGVRHVYAEARPVNPLTPREVEVLGYVARGLRNREIAEALSCSEQNVKNHLRAAMHKLGAPNRTRAVLSAIRLEWLTLPDGIEPSNLGAVVRA